MDDTVDDTTNYAVGDTVDGTMDNTEAAAMALTTEAAESRLLNLPRELRDMIYANLAVTEERTILGRRLIEQRKKDEVTGRNFLRSLTACVALHPLSMTCRQLRDEFQPLHASAPEPNYAFVVNNFDLEQMKVFAAACKPMWPTDYGWNIASHSSICFQLDSDVVGSAEILQGFAVYGLEELSRKWRIMNDRGKASRVAITTAYSKIFTPPADENTKSLRLLRAEHAYDNCARVLMGRSFMDNIHSAPKAKLVPTYRDLVTGSIDEKNCMTVGQAACVGEIFRTLDDCFYPIDTSLADRLTGVPQYSLIGDLLWMQEDIWKPFMEYAKSIGTTSATVPSEDSLVKQT